MKVLLVFLLFLGNLFSNDFKNALQELKNRNYEEAIRLFELSANNGNSRAQTALGHIFSSKKNSYLNYDKAIFWYEQATISNDIIAQYNLGEIYENIKKDYQRAFIWYEEAAKQGAVRAQYKLGLMYAKGLGVKKDEFKAYKLLSIAAKHKIKGAKSALDNLCSKNNLICK